MAGTVALQHLRSARHEAGVKRRVLHLRSPDAAGDAATSASKHLTTPQGEHKGHQQKNQVRPC